jgi:hypothetical protein
MGRHLDQQSLRGPLPSEGRQQRCREAPKDPNDRIISANSTKVKEKLTKKQAKRTKAEADSHSETQRRVKRFLKTNLYQPV